MRRRAFLSAGLAPLVCGEEYVYGPDSARQAGVPRGAVTRHVWTASRVYPGTVHDYWIYVPAQYDGSKAAAVMVFQDGGTFVNEAGAFRVPIVFDNLIHKGEMPVTIGVFVAPGVLPGRHAGEQGRFYRSHEYDAVTGRYARFLLEEILPEVGKTYRLTGDPNLRAISGSSSGGNCSVNAAWERPDGFRRVVSFIAGFTHQRGALILPSQVRKFEGKPLRIFLQDGTGDVNIQSNQDMIAALETAGYDAKLVVGTEGHNSKHGGPLLPEALRWVWRDWTRPIAKPVKSFAARFVDPAGEWERVGAGVNVGGLAVDKAGAVYYSDGGKVRRVEGDAGPAEAGGSGMMFGRDGRLYVARAGQGVVAGGRVVAKNSGCRDVAVDGKGGFYFTETAARRVWYGDGKGAARVVHEGMTAPAGVQMSPDHSLLLVSDAVTRWVWSFQVQGDGSLAYGLAFHRLEIEDEAGEGTTFSGAGGMTVDSEGFVYVCTRLGLQISDPAGRTSAVLLRPEGKELTSVVFGGAGLETLYVTTVDGVWRRASKRKGVMPWEAVKPPVPRL